jgi:hypothetical protein
LLWNKRHGFQKFFKRVAKSEKTILIKAKNIIGRCILVKQKEKFEEKETFMLTPCIDFIDD